VDKLPRVLLRAQGWSTVKCGFSGFITTTKTNKKAQDCWIIFQNKIFLGFHILIDADCFDYHSWSYNVVINNIPYWQRNAAPARLMPDLA